MGGNILNFAITMTTITTASVSFTGKIVYKKTPIITKHLKKKFKNNCTYLPLGGGMACQLKPDALSLYNREVAGVATKWSIDNNDHRWMSDSSMRRVPLRAVYCDIHMVGSVFHIKVRSSTQRATMESKRRPSMETVPG